MARDLSGISAHRDVDVQGLLPEDWGAGWEQLQRLNVTQNALTGAQSAATWWCCLRYAPTEAEQWMHLAGSLPRDWSGTEGLQSLEQLWLGQNDLLGSLPDSFQMRCAKPHCCV